MKWRVPIELLLRLYPASFRARYGGELRSFHEDRIRNGVTGRQWLSIVVDHIRSAAAEHARDAAGGRAARRERVLGGLKHDVRYGVRSLRRRPLFTVVVTATIALGIGANTAIFSIVHAVLLRPLPYAEPDRMVLLGHEAPLWLASLPEYVDYTRVRSFEALAAYTRGEANLSVEEEAERVAIASVTPNLFAVTGVLPLLGRPFLGDDDLATPADVVIISHALWQRRYGGDETVLGRGVSLAGRTRTIIGVMPPAFDFPSAHTDVWLPMPRITADRSGDRTNHYLFMVGRVRAGVTLEQAANETRSAARTMFEEHPASYDPKHPPTPVLTRVEDALVGEARPYLWALLGTVAFVLLTACANVANLLLSRGEGRRREMALRGALGASRARLLRQLLVETLLLAGAGGAGGVLLALLAQRALILLSPESLPRLEEIGIDLTVFGYAAALSLVAALVFGLAPALRVSREAPAAMLKQAGRSLRAGSSRRLRQSLVVAEVALAVMLLTGAGMLLRSLVNLQSESLGFDSANVLTAKVSLTAASYDEARSALFFGELLNRLRATPDVAAVGAAGWLPVIDQGGQWGVLAEGQSYDRLEEGSLAVPQQVTPGYFDAMRIPIMRGRDFSEHDRPTGPFVAIVSESMARALWPGEDALGRRFRLGGGETYVTVVGIVGDIRARGFGDVPEPTMYFPYAQTATAVYFMPRSMSIVIRTNGAPQRAAPALRDIVKSMDATVPVSRVLTLDHVVGSGVSERRLTTALITGFAALALVLAAIGIFGVVSWGVSERTYEIGVRVALGAERASVLALVVADSTRMAAAGLLLGLVGAAMVGRTIQFLLIGVPLLDPVTYGLASVLIAAIVVAATALPARRALLVDPARSLRDG